MCGIVGYISTTQLSDETFIGMTEMLTRRGPDIGGHWSNCETVHLGHRRLSIIDLSDAAAQPMSSPGGRWVVVFNGEIYNYHELRVELERKGYNFRTSSDTEVILAGYQAWGEACLRRFRGMFALAIWDVQEQSLFAARDRLGKKPFYYHWDGNSLIFASELKGITTWPGFRREIDPLGLQDYLSYGYIPGTRTIWRRVNKLAPGHTLHHNRGAGGLQTHPYWELDLTPDHGPSSEEWGEGLRHHLSESVKLRLVADVPLGALLSGGIDSSVVVALMAEQSTEPPRTFAVGFDDQRLNELPFAQIVAERHHTRHTALTLEPSNLHGALETVIHSFDEPFNDTSYFPTLFVCQEIRKHVTVALSGDGGDELFFGYEKYREAEQLARIARGPGLLALARGPLALYPARVKGKDHVNDQYAGARIWGRSLSPLGFRDQSEVRGIMQAIGVAPEAEYDAFDQAAVLAKHAQERGWDPLNTLRYLYLKMMLPDQMFTKVDRAAMAASLEVRSPLADHVLVEYVSRIPPAKLLDGGKLKGLLKRAMADRLPEAILNRPKQGFSAPLDKWLGSELGPLYDELAQGPNMLVAPQVLGEQWKAYRTFADGPAWQRRVLRAPTMRLQNLAFLELWARKWL